MKLSDIAAAIAQTNVPTGYTVSHRQDSDSLEHIIHIDGPNGWYAEITHVHQLRWLRNAVTDHVNSITDNDSAV